MQNRPYGRLDRASSVFHGAGVYPCVCMEHPAKGPPPRAMAARPGQRYNQACVSYAGNRGSGRRLPGLSSALLSCLVPRCVSRSCCFPSPCCWQVAPPGPRRSWTSPLPRLRMQRPRPWQRTSSRASSPCRARGCILDGKPYRFAGANFWYGAYLGAPGRARRSRTPAFRTGPAEGRRHRQPARAGDVRSQRLQARRAPGDQGPARRVRRGPAAGAWTSCWRRWASAT